jgi:hypothetical protein
MAIPDQNALPRLPPRVEALAQTFLNYAESKGFTPTETAQALAVDLNFILVVLQTVKNIPKGPA